MDTRYEVDGRTVGTLRGSTLIKEDRQVWLFDDAFGVEEDVLLDNKVDRVEVRWSGRVWRANVNTFLEEGFKLVRPPVTLRVLATQHFDGAPSPLAPQLDLAG